MIKREGFFETNSSSTHALCIAKGGFKEPHLLLERLFERYDWSTDVDNEEDYFPITTGIEVSSFRDYEEDSYSTITLRRLRDIGRVFKIYSSIEAKLNFIWSCLVSRCNYDMKDYLYKFLRYLYIDSFQYTGKHLNIQYGDIEFKKEPEPAKDNTYNKPVNILKLDEANFVLPKELKNKYMVGIIGYGYVPKEELMTILDDEKLFWNLVLGNSKIYTGSDETDLFEDLDFSNYSYKLVGGSDSGDSYPTNIFAFNKVKPIGSYINGNYETKIYEDGTRTRELLPHNTFYDQGRYMQERFALSEIDMMEPAFPESIDLKITNYCENNCKYCYANSSKSGQHAKIHDVLDVIREMKPYTEIALGGGNVLDYPYLVDVLHEAKDKNIIVNITLKDVDYIKYYDMVNEMIERKLIKSIGISPTNADTLKEVSDLITWNHNVVLHLVLGLYTVEFIKAVFEMTKFDKFLFLGYKTTKGKGESYYIAYKDSIQKNIKEFGEYFKNTYISEYKSVAFDNLAIDQLDLDVKNFYKELYQGEDGKFSFYIDFVEQEYAKSSVEERKHYFLSINNAFEDLKKERLYESKRG